MPRYFEGAVINGATLVLASPNGVCKFVCRCGQSFTAVVEDVVAGKQATCGCAAAVA